MPGPGPKILMYSMADVAELQSDNGEFQSRPARRHFLTKRNERVKELVRSRVRGVLPHVMVHNFHDERDFFFINLILPQASAFFLRAQSLLPAAFRLRLLAVTSMTMAND